MVVQPGNAVATRSAAARSHPAVRGVPLTRMLESQVPIVVFGVVGQTVTATITLASGLNDLSDTAPNALLGYTTTRGDNGLVTVTRTGSTTASLAVVLTVTGSATNGSDYANIPTTLTIPVGATSATIAVTVNDDALHEGTETAVIGLGALKLLTEHTYTGISMFVPLERDSRPRFQLRVGFLF